MNIVVKLKARQVEALQDGDPLTVHLLPPRRSGREALPADLEILVRAWNESEYVLRDGLAEGRNNPVPAAEAASLRPTLERAVAELGLQTILDRMDEYWAACRDGRHRSAGRNHGYGHLGGFIRALLGGKSLWWRKGSRKVPDDHPELTRRVADAYAGRFLHRKAFGLKNPSGPYRRFAEAADWIQLTAEKGRLGEDKLLELLLDCVAERGGTVSPGHLSSEHTWSVGMPQWIKGVLG
jgi:hypothetical protein